MKPTVIHDDALFYEPLQNLLKKTSLRKHAARSDAWLMTLKPALINTLSSVSGLTLAWTLTIIQGRMEALKSKETGRPCRVTLLRHGTPWEADVPLAIQRSGIWDERKDLWGLQCRIKQHVDCQIKHRSKQPEFPLHVSLTGLELLSHWFEAPSPAVFDKLGKEATQSTEILKSILKKWPLQQDNINGSFQVISKAERGKMLMLDWAPEWKTWAETQPEEVVMAYAAQVLEFRRAFVQRAGKEVEWHASPAPSWDPENSVMANASDWLSKDNPALCALSSWVRDALMVPNEPGASAKWAEGSIDSASSALLFTLLAHAWHVTLHQQLLDLRPEKETALKRQMKKAGARACSS